MLKVIAECGVSVREVSMFREANAPIYMVKVIVTGPLPSSDDCMPNILPL